MDSICFVDSSIDLWLASEFFLISWCYAVTFLMLAIVRRILSWTNLALVQPGPPMFSKSSFSLRMILSSFLNSVSSLSFNLTYFSSMPGSSSILSQSSLNFCTKFLCIFMDDSLNSSALSWGVFCSFSSTGYSPAPWSAVDSVWVSVLVSADCFCCSACFCCSYLFFFLFLPIF